LPNGLGWKLINYMFESSFQLMDLNTHISKCKNESDEGYMWFGVTLENNS
jgi:hypothetical protein